MNNQTIYYTFQHRVIAKSPWLKCDEPLQLVESEWSNSSYDSFGFVISPWKNQAPVYRNVSDELYSVWQKTRSKGFLSFNLAKQSLSRLRAANEEGKFDYKDTYRHKEQVVRFEFRIVKVTHTPDVVEPVVLKLF